MTTIWRWYDGSVRVSWYPGSCRREDDFAEGGRESPTLVPERRFRPPARAERCCSMSSVLAIGAWRRRPSAHRRRWCSAPALKFHAAIRAVGSASSTASGSTVVRTDASTRVKAPSTRPSSLRRPLRCAPEWWDMTRATSSHVIRLESTIVSEEPTAPVSSPVIPKAPACHLQSFISRGGASSRQPIVPSAKPSRTASTSGASQRRGRP